MPPGWCGTSVTPAPSSSAPRSTDSEADREVLLRTRSLTAAALDERPVLLAIGLLGALWGIAVAAGGLTSFYLCATLIACSLIVFQGLDFANAAAYLREWVAKPLLMVVFALLAGAAVAKSARPEKWLIPAIISMCLMAVLVPVYVAHSGTSLNQLASSEAREF